MTEAQNNHTIQTLVNGIYRIQIDRADKLNALAPEVYREIKNGVLRASGDPNARVILIEGQPGSFAVGGDLKRLLDITRLPPGERLLAFSNAYVEPVPFQAILDSPKMVVAKIDGLCLAGGLVIASCADVAIASERSTFGVPEGRVGLADPFCSSLLPLTIGLSRARYMMMTAKRIDAQTALAWGILQEVVSAEMLEDATMKIVADLVAVSPLAQAAYKVAANAYVRPMDGLKVCEVAFTEDGTEGLSAFAQKRVPKWKNG
jgi:enoyl-CoA hydratase/carnithine racemase